MRIPAMPSPQVDTLANGAFTLAAALHAGRVLPLHCPICLKYALEPGRLQPEFDKRRVKVLLVSGDGRERAQTFSDKLNAPALRVGYGLGLASARDRGLYISTSRGQASTGVGERALFSKPGVFLVRPDGALYYDAVQTTPFARSRFDELMAAVDFAVAKDYPARGEYTGAC